jgi:putative hemolysin
LVIGELVPKRLGLSNPEAVARYMSRPMRFLSVAIGPVVRLLSFTTDFSLKVLGVRAPSEPPVTEDEIRALIDEGTAAGVFHEAEQDMVESVLLLDDRRINALMTPRPEVVWLDLDDPADDLRRKITDSPYSRFPVGQGSLDRVLGEVQAKDMLIHVMEGKPFDLRPLLKRPLFVPETMPALKVLEAFKVSSTQMAMVVDEYGSVEGVVTLTDILEAIVGDIPSADEVAEPQAVQRGDGTWLVDGMLPIDEFKELLQIGELPGEDQGLYQSLGGFVTTRLEHVPSTGEHFAWAGWTYEVMDMDGTRVDKVLMMPEGAASEGQPGTTEE